MTTKTKSTKKTATTDNTAQITTLVKSYLFDGVHINDIAQDLISLGLNFASLESDIMAHAITEKLVMSQSELDKAIKEGIAKSPVSSFYDVTRLACSLGKQSVSTSKIKGMIVAQSEVNPENLKPHKKYKKLFNPNQKHGQLTTWILDNPNFSDSELIDFARTISDSPNVDDYSQEILAYKNYFLVDYLAKRGEKIVKV